MKLTQGKIAKVLGQSAFWIVNKSLAKKFKDNDMALIISDMLDKQQFFTNSKSLIEGYWWYNTQKSVLEDCNINAKRHKKYMDKLQSLGIIERVKRGHPCKTYYHIDEDKIAGLVL